MPTRRDFSRLLLTGSAAALAGCKKDPFQPGYNILVELNRTMFSAKNEPVSLEVHVVMLPFALAKNFEKVPMSDYWNPAAPESPFAKYKMYFGPGKPSTQTLPAEDVIWRRWQQGAPPLREQWIFVMADIKGAFKDQESSQDARRIILPADPKLWPAGRTIHISVGKDGMVNLTPRIHRA
jgi:hypothetical protein